MCVRTKQIGILWWCFLSALVLHAPAELISLYRFDGDATDAVGGREAMWIANNQNTPPDWQSQGLINGAIRFPGLGSHINYFAVSGFPEVNGSAGMTAAAWFKPGGNSGYRGILMSRQINGNQLFGFGHENGHLDGRVNSQQLDTPPNSVLANGEWYHIAWVWDNVRQTQQLFINGSPSGSPRSVPPQNITSNSDWRIGDDSCCNNRNLNGWLDDLAIYDEPLGPSDIRALYQNGLDGYSANEEPPPPVTEPLNVGLVINEIHHDADPKTEPAEFVEILNTGPDSIDLGGYYFEGIDFVFPAKTFLDATEYVVIGEGDLYDFRYDGRLSGDGEEITLRDPAGNIVDRVNYRVEFPWPIIEEGRSMQLVNATLDNDLGASWRPALPTPGFQNQTFALNSPPLLRQVSHVPQAPDSTDSITVSVKATDPDGVNALTLHYQINSPGAFVPAFLPLSSPVLRSNPQTSLTPNPDFEDNWIAVSMTPDASGEFFTATIPAQPHRTLIRYRISATDSLENAIRAPFPEDPSLNFAVFVYDGLPDYRMDHGDVVSSSTLNQLPVYHLITNDSHLTQCWAYGSGDRVSSVASRKKFNWEGAMVYDGVVYDHVKYRLRQRNDRYAGNGRRSMRFRFPQGHFFQARDPEGNRYPVKWRSFNTSKMSRFNEGANWGMRELVSSRLWNLAGVTAPEFQHIHFRVIDDAVEQTNEREGDFYGLSMIFEDVDAQFLEGRDLPRGNVYKLKDGESNPLELQKYQARSAVSDGSDFVNIRDHLGPPTRSDKWLRNHVDWPSWYLYAALGEGFRHYDFSPHFQKNRIWYFKPDPGTPFGLMSVIPHDTDATWKRGTNDHQWNDPAWGPGNGFRGRVVGYDLPKEAIAEITGLDGSDGENHPEREAFMLEYRNVLREVSDLLWHPETVHAVIDEAHNRIAPFEAADIARWGHREVINPLGTQVALMKSLAFTEDLYQGSSLSGGRAQWLKNLALDSQIPNKPTLSRDGEILTSSPFSDPQGPGTFQAMQWRLSETSTHEWQSTWSAVSTTDAIPPPARATRPGLSYRARVRHQDETGRWSHWSDPLEFVASSPDLTPFLNGLIISEIMYHPENPTPEEVAAGFTDDDDFEYLEVRNISDQTIILDNVRFTKGIDADLSGTLSPGDFALVVRNRDAFEMRYGTGLPVIGEFRGRLDNGGERIKLSFGAGLTIRDFHFDDAQPWPTSPDGEGSSLVLINPFGLVDPNNPHLWRAANPNPGMSDTTRFESGDLLAYAMRGNLSLTANQVTIEFNERAEDLSLTFEASTDLSSWQPVSANLVNRIVTTDGFARFLFEFTPPDPMGTLFLRASCKLR
ncbi:MAG: lamin tail domain-containing protein [Akkermansiaceae bacterium]